VKELQGIAVRNIPLLEKEGWPTASGLAAGVVSPAKIVQA